MGICRICQKKSFFISNELGLCLDCIRCEPEQSREIGQAVHGRIRRDWGLPGQAPRNTGGLVCDLCVNRCQIADGSWGYCGLRKNVGGKIEGVSATKGKLSWYLDPLPTNCVGSWVCPAGSECGYPEYAYAAGAEYGYENLAVFPHACTFHCLYCQNWHFRYHTFSDRYESPESVARAVNNRTACICYFGGDPSPQLPYLLHISRIARESRKGRILRICWETNGAMSKRLLEDVAESSLASGGCIKFDLKAWDETLHIALTGVTNRRTQENFKWLARVKTSRRGPPLLIASTLMVPGYIDAQEVGRIAKFIAALNPQIPYSLLAFHPDYHMADLAPTSRNQARRCLDAARQAGLSRVKIGNMHLIL